jgi:hypothetical protein
VGRYRGVVDSFCGGIYGRNPGRWSGVVIVAARLTAPARISAPALLVVTLLAAGALAPGPISAHRRSGSWSERSSGFGLRQVGPDGSSAASARGRLASTHNVVSSILTVVLGTFAQAFDDPKEIARLIAAGTIVTVVSQS